MIIRDKIKNLLINIIWAEIADEDMSGLTPTKISTNKNEWQDFGYYTDDNGYKRFGVIPHDQQIPAAL